jgi:predicted amidohydrolase
MIVDYWGDVLGRRREGVGIVVADLDFEAQHALRSRFPVLAHRHPSATLKLQEEDQT